MHLRQINWNKINKFTLILKKLKIANDPTDSGIKFKLTNYSNDSEYDDNDNITLRYFKSDSAKPHKEKNLKIKNKKICRKSKATGVKETVSCANIGNKDKDDKLIVSESESGNKEISNEILQLEADEVNTMNGNINNQMKKKIRFIDSLLNYLFVRRSNKIIGLQFIYMLLIYENNISNDSINGTSTRRIRNNDNCEEEFYYYPILKVPEKLEMVE